MIVNGAALKSIYTSFKTIFNRAIQATKPLYQQVATVVPSSAREEEYKWLGKIPKMREWIGERVVTALAAFGYSIKNKDWEVTIGVDRNDIEDDTLGVYSPMVEMMGASTAQHPDELVFELLGNGFTGLCYDGQYFFDADHQDGDGPIQSNRSNKILAAAAYGDARAAMMSLTDEHGNPLSIMPGLLVVPPQLEAAGRAILESERDANGATNIWRGSAQLLVVPWLAKWPTHWFLLDASKPIKPLIFQQRKPVQFVAMDNAEDEGVFMKKEFRYGADSRDNAGYGLWQLAYGSTGEVA